LLDDADNFIPLVHLLLLDAFYCLFVFSALSARMLGEGGDLPDVGDGNFFRTIVEIFREVQLHFLTSFG
jgi:hypothetical protein